MAWNLRISFWKPPKVRKLVRQSFGIWSKYHSIGRPITYSFLQNRIRMQYQPVRMSMITYIEYLEILWKSSRFRICKGLALLTGRFGIAELLFSPRVQPCQLHEQSVRISDTLILCRDSLPYYNLSTMTLMASQLGWLEPEDQSYATSAAAQLPRRWPSESLNHLSDKYPAQWMCTKMNRGAPKRWHTPHILKGTRTGSSSWSRNRVTTQMILL